MVFAGGGTGGHLFPALAVVEHFRRHGLEVDAEFLCTSRPADARTLDAWSVAHTPQPVQPLRLHPLKLPGFYLSWRRSLGLCVRRFRERRPAVVVGTGGYGSGPAVVAAARLGVPCALLNPDAVPGRANRHLASYVDEIYVQWAATRERFKDPVRVHVTGCPVRAAFEAGAPGAHAALGLDPERRTLLVTGASLGAHTLNEAMRVLAPEIAARGAWQVLHVCGQRDEPLVRETYAKAGVPAVVRPFIADMPAALHAAELVLSRAGAVTLAELTAAGRPAVLLPYPYHRDQHQRENGRILAEAGAAVLLEDLRDAEANAGQLRRVLLPLLDDPGRCAAMGRAAAAAGHPRAAERVAERLLAVAGIRRARNSQVV